MAANSKIDNQPLPDIHELLAMQDFITLDTEDFKLRPNRDKETKAQKEMNTTLRRRVS